MEEENSFVRFLTKHWSKLLLSILALAATVAWSERLLGARKHGRREDYFTAQQIFERFQRGEVLNQESVATAENILSRHPELHPKFDSFLALHFFSNADISKGVSYTQTILENAPSKLPSPYAEYGRATLLISEQQYAQAFESSKALHKQLNGLSEYQYLDAMNTLRLVFLAEELGDETQKKTFFAKLETHPGYAQIKPLFQEGAITLADYIVN